MVAAQHPSLRAIAAALAAFETRGTAEPPYGDGFRDGFQFARSLLDAAEATPEAVAAILARFEARLNAEKNGMDWNAPTN